MLKHPLVEGGAADVKDIDHSAARVVCSTGAAQPRTTEAGAQLAAHLPRTVLGGEPLTHTPGPPLTPSNTAIAAQ